MICLNVLEASVSFRYRRFPEEKFVWVDPMQPRSEQLVEHIIRQSIHK